MTTPVAEQRKRRLNVGEPKSVSATQARQVLAVAECRSFSKAAAQLGSSQSAVSNAVATLEAQLGLVLFIRSTHDVKPSSFFNRMRASFARVVRADEALLAATSELRAQGEAVLRVGLSPVVDVDRVERAIRAFEHESPSTQVELVELNLADLIRALDDESIDIAIAPVSTRAARFKSLQLYQEPLLVVRASRSTAPVVLDSLGDELVLMAPDVCGLARATVALFQKRKLRLRRAKTRALGYQLMERAALHGRGVAILPSSKVSQEGAPLLARVGSPALLMVHALLRRHGRSSANAIELARLFTV